MLSAKANEVL